MTTFDAAPTSASPTDAGAAGVGPSGLPRLNVLLIVAGVLLGVVGALSMFDPFDMSWQRPIAYAALGAVSSIVLMTAAIVSISVADRRDMAELGFVGSGLLSMSVLTAAHAAVTPDALYNDNEAFAIASLLVFPAFVVASLPVLLSTTRIGTWGARHWRDWSILSTFAAFVTAFALAGLPDAWPTLSTRGPVSIVVSATSFTAMMVLTRRFHRRHVISGSPHCLIMCVALAGLAIASLAPMANVFGLGFWGLRVIGFVSALAVAGSTLAVGTRATQTQLAFSSVLRVDPLLALDLAASPVVHRYLETEPDATACAGTADLALHVADRMKLSVAQRRNLGLAAVMHDVGKTFVPAEILSTPGPLSSEQFQVVQQHAALGAEMLASDVWLGPCAPIVRSHHERVDGAGYPDGLVGAQIPIEARIIAACDAFDAITNDREYRRGLPVGLSLAILTSNAGQQWDADVVRHLMLVVAERNLASTTPDSEMPDAAASITVPDDLAELLQQVDCEI